MNIDVQEVPFEQKSVLAQLMQLYLYDFSEIDGADVNNHGRFEYRYLDHYWTESGRTPFLIYVDGKTAGLALVREHSVLWEDSEARSISEFFIMRKYRRQGIGKRVVFEIFDRFPGKWEVQQTTQNFPAQRFWRTVISDYTGGHYEETVVDNGRWQGPTQTFDNGHVSRK